MDVSVDPAGATATRPQATLAEAEPSPTTTAKLEVIALALSRAVRTCAARSPAPRTSSSRVPCCCSMAVRPGCCGGTRLIALPAARIMRKGPLASLIQPSGPVRRMLPAGTTSPRPSARSRPPGPPSTTVAAPAVSTTSQLSEGRPGLCQSPAGGVSKTVSLAVRSPAAAPTLNPARDTATTGKVQKSARRPPIRRRSGIVGGIERYPVCVFVAGMVWQLRRRCNQQGKRPPGTILEGDPEAGDAPPRGERPDRVAVPDLSGLPPGAPAGGEDARPRI